MEITAIFKGLAQYQEGVNKKGEAWKKQDAVFETTGQYPKTIAISGFNSVADILGKCQVNQAYDIKIDIESREWNGRWYTNVTAFSVTQRTTEATSVQQNAKAQAEMPKHQPSQYLYNPNPSPQLPGIDDEKDDLPF